jgi:hypothetical protein
MSFYFHEATHKKGTAVKYHAMKMYITYLTKYNTIRARIHNRGTRPYEVRNLHLCFLTVVRNVVLLYDTSKSNL